MYKQDQRNLSFVIIEKDHNSSGTCGIMNAIDIFTHLSLNTVQSLFAEGLSKIAVLYDSNDQTSKEFLKINFKAYITLFRVGLPDVEYAMFQPIIKNCQNVIYLQNYFTVNSQELLQIARNLPQYSAAFTLNANKNREKIELADLTTLNLEQVTQK